MTDVPGAYSITFKGAGGPCNLQVTDPVSGFVLRSIGVASGTVKITPLTEALVVFSSGDVAKLANVKVKFSTTMASIASSLTGDPLTARRCYLRAQRSKALRR